MEPFRQKKGSSMWHCEAPLILRVYIELNVVKTEIVFSSKKTLQYIYIYIIKKNTYIYSILQKCTYLCNLIAVSAKLLYTISNEKGGFTRNISNV